MKHGEKFDYCFDAVIGQDGVHLDTMWNPTIFLTQQKQLASPIHTIDAAGTQR